MFISLKKLKQAITEVITGADADKSEILKLKKEVSALKEEPQRLKADIEDLKLKKKMELKEIEALVSLNEKKLEVERSQMKVDLQKDYQEELLKLNKEFHAKTIDLLTKKGEEFGEMYKEIMKRLPNVNMSIRERRGEAE